MIKIIKSGRKSFTAVCSKCGCQFSYELEDVDLNSVCCPECGERVAHPTQYTMHIPSTVYPYVQPEILPSATGVPYPLSDVLYTSSDSTHRVEGVTIEARNTDE